MFRHIVERHPDEPAGPPNFGLRVIPSPSGAIWLMLQQLIPQDKNAVHHRGLPPMGDLARREQNAVDDMEGKGPTKRT